MKYINQVIDEFLDDDVTQNNVFEVAHYLLTNGNPDYLQEFCSTYICSDTAADVAFANPSVCDDYFEANPMEPELIMNHMPPKQLAYHLTFTEPAKATELLDELLYYRKNGRI